MESQRYDAIIVGTGQAGPPLAARLSAAGQSVAIIERDRFGGTCVNVGCTPTKAMVASAKVAQTIRLSAEYGIVGSTDVTVDMPKVVARKNEIAGGSSKGVEAWMRGLDNVTVIQGHARFEDARHLRVGELMLESDQIFLNVGGRPSEPDIPGLRDVDYLTNASIMELQEVPEHLVVIGGGYIGLEFGQMFRRFGAEVTIVDRGSRLIRNEDEDTSAEVRGILEAEGVTIRTEADCISLQPAESGGSGVTVGVKCADGEPAVTGSHVLVAIGRVPNTDDLGLEAAGIEVDGRGFIVVDDELRTTTDGVWALGDCNGQGAFTHTAYNDFEIVAANLLDGESRRLSDRILVYGLFIDPPLARVGMSERQVRESGRPALRGKRRMTRVSRAVEKGETQGFIKLLVDAETDEILGAAILGVGGDEAIHCIIDVMNAGATADVIRRSVHIHPTVAELIPTVLGSLRPL